MFSWGANSHGQLGLGVINEQVEKPTDVSISTYSINTVRNIACGGAHTLLLDNEGKLFSCGWNQNLQCGIEFTKEEETSIFGRVWNLSGITFTNIACGWNFSCGITDDHFLFVWGSNKYGELGLPKDHFPQIVKPVRLQVHACAVSMGLRHSAIINSKAEVWITGCGRHGQLGLGSTVLSSDRFQKVSKVGKISHIACGQNHTTAWSSDENALYVWGDNRHGQLLLNTEKYRKVFTPQKIDIDIKHKVKKLLSGWTNTLLWLENDQLITWGNNSYGQLGIDECFVGKMKQIRLPGDRKVKDVALGSEHTICLATDNTLWAWGWNEHANTGTNSEEKCIYSPVQVPIAIDNSIYTILQIFAGGAHNFVVVGKKQKTDNDINNT